MGLCATKLASPTRGPPIIQEVFSPRASRRAHTARQEDVEGSPQKKSPLRPYHLPGGILVRLPWKSSSRRAILESFAYYMVRRQFHAGFDLTFVVRAGGIGRR